MSDLSMSTVVSARSDLLTTQLSDSEQIMLDAEQGRYFGLEHVANTVWSAISEPCSVAEVCDAVMHAYRVDADVVEADTKAFLQQLLDAGLARRHDSAG